VYERAVHGASVQACGVLRLRDEDERAPGGLCGKGPRGARGGKGRRGARGGGVAGLAGRLDREAHEQRLLDAERDGLVGAEERDDGAVLAGAPSAVGCEAAQVGARDAERGGGVRLGARRELGAAAADEAVAAEERGAGGGGRRGPRAGAGAPLGPSPEGPLARAGRESAHAGGALNKARAQRAFVA